MSDVSDHSFWWGLGQDLRDGGVFLATHLPLRLGTTVDLVLRLAEVPEPLHLTGVVRWTRTFSRGSDVPPGVGIKLVSASTEALESMTRFVETARDALLYDLDDPPARHRRSSRPRPPAITS